jgi:hypothetical protein
MELLSAVTRARTIVGIIATALLVLSFALVATLITDSKPAMRQRLAAHR